MPRQGWEYLDRTVDGDERFLAFEAGDTRSVRILDQSPFVVMMHQIRGATADGEDVFMSVPQTEDKREDWIERVSEGRQTASPRYFVRVFDHETESVRVFMGGITIFRQLRTIDSNATKKGLMLCDFDVDITRDGEGRETRWSVSVAVESVETDVEKWREYADDVECDFHPDQLFPSITPERQQELIEASGIDIETDPAALLMEEMDYDEAKEVVVPFGKHNGSTVGEIMATDKSWVAWAADKVTSNDVVAAACRIMMARIAGSSPAKPSLPSKGSGPRKAPKLARPSPAASTDADERLEAISLAKSMLPKSPIERVKVLREATGGKKTSLALLNLEEINNLVEALS